VAKCKQTSILTTIQNDYNCTNRQKATESKDGSGNWPMSNFLLNTRFKDKGISVT
jgi:hypothetical protein